MSSVSSCHSHLYQLISLDISTLSTLYKYRLLRFPLLKFEIFDMPAPTTWYCGHCGYGPHYYSYQEFCVMCNRKRDYSARFESQTTSARPPPAGASSQYGLYGGSSPSTSNHYQPSMHVNTTPYATPQAGYQAPTSTGQSYPTSYSPIRFWWCCRCQDGPKNATLQPSCVMCHHQPCSYCKRA